MSDTDESVHPKPLILLASSETADLHDVETALFSVGYRVVIARSERETLQRAREHQPTAIVLDGEIGSPERTTCATLRAQPGVSPATPIVLTRVGQLTRTDRLTTLGEGAWDVQTDLDMEELLVRLGVYLHAKLELERLNAECLLDPESGLYNSRGFQRRTTELGAFASRQGLPAVCAVFRPAQRLPDRATAIRLGRAFRSVSRLSDAIGRTDETEFAVFASGTNPFGAARLVHRLAEGVQKEAQVAVRASYSTALPSQRVAPLTLLDRARGGLENRAL